jgi:hypothetical protein
METLAEMNVRPDEALVMPTVGSWPIVLNEYVDDVVLPKRFVEVTRTKYSVRARSELSCAPNDCT